MAAVERRLPLNLWLPALRWITVRARLDSGRFSSPDRAYLGVLGRAKR